jgi:tetratricopeptide (TPR) repeat protein
VPPGVSANVSALTRRLSAYLDGGDPALVLEPAAEEAAAGVLESCVRETLRTQQVEVQSRLSMLGLTGLLFYLRSMRVVEENAQRDRDLGLAVALFTPQCDISPSDVPELIADNVPKAEQQGELQIENWSGYCGLLLTAEHEADRTVLFAVLAVLQLALAKAKSRHHRMLCLGSLVRALTWLHNVRVDPEVAAAAVVFNRWLIAETQDGTPEHAHALGQMSNTLRLRYAHNRDPEVLAEAISLGRKAIAALPRDHPVHADCMASLCDWLQARYTDQGDPEALREAIALWRAMACELPADSLEKAEALDDLARSLEKLVTLNTDGRHDGPAGSVDLLDEIVVLGREALATCDAHGPGNPALRSALLAGLSRHLRRRADLSWQKRPQDLEKASADLEEALRLARQARQTAPSPHRLGTALAALIDTLSSQYDRSSDPAVLDEAIALAREGVRAADGNPSEMPARYTLGALLDNRYSDFGDTKDALEAADVLRTVAHSPSATIPDRLEAAFTAGKLAASREDWSSAADDLALAVQLLPKLAEWQLRDSDKERKLEAYTPVPALAAECALAVGQPERALELLEQGRCVLDAETAAIRVNLDRLSSQDPALGDALRRLPGRLRSAPDADSRSRLHAVRRRCITQIRSLPGFADFLTPPSLDEIVAACAQGPVAVPILGRYRAAVLLATRDGIRRVPLPLLTFEAVRQMTHDILGGVDRALDRQNSPSERMMGEYSLRAGLAQLWDAAVGPVLDALRDEPSIQARGGLGGADPPRMWWCPTGLLSFFPFHMAARHEEGDAFDLVLSSYTPTVHALGRTELWRPARDSHPLVVVLPHTPGAPDLPSADREAAVLTTIYPDARLLRGRAATRAKFTAALPDHDILHVACHSGYDAHHGYEGHLLLSDGRMHIADIATMRTGRAAGLAFLSACGTARGRTDLPDESRTLLTAFQSAGFTHLVGSLWPVADQANSRLVESFYSAVTTSTGDTVATALHHAVRRLRDHAPDRPSLWAPHLHLGP